MGKMLDKWRSFRDTVDDTTATIRSILWMVGIVAVIILVIRKWLESLDTIQTAALWVALVCVGLIVVTYYLDWQRKRNVDRMPELLAQLDKLTLDYINDYTKTAPFMVCERMGVNYQT
jgi:amino acid permease